VFFSIANGTPIISAIAIVKRPKIVKMTPAPILAKIATGPRPFCSWFDHLDKLK